MATVAMGKYSFSSSESKPQSQSVVHTIISKQEYLMVVLTWNLDEVHTLNACFRFLEF